MALSGAFSWLRRRSGDLAGLMPHGTPLPEEDWTKRHGVISAIAMLHVPVVFVYALVTGVGVAHGLVETSPVLAAAMLGRRGHSRQIREAAATFSLVTSSAVLVHLSGGYIELHFHFFVIVALVTLYQQWNPFLLAIVYVLVHHGIAGAIDPRSVYNHPSAVAHPWAWAAVHATFIAMASAVGMANWKLNELARQRSEDYFRRLYEGESAVVQRLQEADRIKSELVAAVSHEFRTPLTSILGFSDALKRGQTLRDGSAQDLGARIHKQGRRLQQLVENLLEAEKPLDSVDGTSDAGAVVAASVDTAVSASRPDRDRVFVEVTSGLQLRLPAHALQVVVTNLVANALKFSTPGTPITVRAYPAAGTEAIVEVSNLGPAIPNHLRERIFEPFVQGDSSSTRTADGVGLGLHLVRRIVSAANGRVSVASCDGTTTFAVSIPATTEPRAHARRELATSTS